MFQIVDIKAFLATARLGSFSAAARDAGVSTSVVTKRVSRLEDIVGQRLFLRSTRRLVLTPEGERLRPRLQVLVAELEETIFNTASGRTTLRGKLRIKAPTTLGTLFVGQSLAQFQAGHPEITTELILMDRSVNPLEENFDIALGALPSSYAGVHDVPLCEYQRMLVAAPGYIRRFGAPADPNEIIQHACVAFLPVGPSWSFEADDGPRVVDIRAVFAANDSRALLAATLQGLGIAVIPRFMAEPLVREGRLHQLLPGFPVASLWFKAMVPRNRSGQPEVTALIAHLREDFAALPPASAAADPTHEIAFVP